MIKKDVAGRMFATFSRTKAKYIKLLLGIFMSAVVIVFWAVWQWKTSAVPEEFNWLNFIYPMIILIGGASKILYDIYLDMPYLHFTEDQFYFDEDGKEKPHYWRDVTDIGEVTLMDGGTPGADNAVLIVVRGKDQFTIDPRLVDFKGADLAAIAGEFWENAKAKIAA
ncbi:MAG: hypothetical protein HWE25_01710 [Alphaproteobacteria bacterium]|nr:hypothetical protein [Alphaproteobacteria bacterium]